MMLKDAHKRTMFAVRGAVSLASRPMRRVVPRSCRVRAQSGCPGGIVCRGPRAENTSTWQSSITHYGRWLRLPESHSIHGSRRDRRWIGGVRVEMRVWGPVSRSGMHRHACD